MSNFNIDIKWKQMLIKNKEFNTKIIKKEKKESIPLSYVIWDEELNKELKNNDLVLQKIELSNMYLEDKYEEINNKINNKINNEINNKINNEIKNEIKNNSLITYLPNFITQYFI